MSGCGGTARCLWRMCCLWRIPTLIGRCCRTRGSCLNAATRAPSATSSVAIPSYSWRAASTRRSIRSPWASPTPPSSATTCSLASIASSGATSPLMREGLSASSTRPKKYEVLSNHVYSLIFLFLCMGINILEFVASILKKYMSQ